MSNRRELGRRIRERREELGLTQVQLAARLETSQVNLSRWETGAVKIGLDELMAVAAELKTTLGDLTTPRPAAKVKKRAKHRPKGLDAETKEKRGGDSGGPK